MTNTEITESHVRLFLRRGLSAARADDLAEARRCFQAVLDKDPDNITALLWLAWLAPSRRQSLTLLSRVLELDPANERAQAAIRWARHRPPIREHTGGAAPSSSSQFDGSHPVEESPPQPSRLPGRTDLLLGTLHSPEAKEKTRIGIAAQRARKLIGPLGLLLIVAACLFAIGVALIAWYSPSTVLAWMLPTATPVPPLAGNASVVATSPATPTILATQPPSPTPTATFPNATTQTLTPSPTGVPTPSPSPHRTASPAQAPMSPPSADDDKWIDVDLTQQRLTAYQSNTPVFEATVSTGLPNTPTVVGQFRIYWKLTAADMAGPGYYLPDVPYTMYFHGGYALHGTYWHSNFGQPMSHGCVNLRTEDAEWLFDWVDPPLPAGTGSVRSNNSNPGTLVVVHH